MEQHARVAAPPACRRTDEWRLAALCSTDTIAKSGRCFEKEPHRLRGDYRPSHSLRQNAYMHARLNAVATSSRPHPRAMLLPLYLPTREGGAEGCTARRW